LGRVMIIGDLARL